jgi:hypothetical protein
MAMGRSAHTVFKDLLLKKSLSAKHWQKIYIPRKTSAELLSRVMYTSKNAVLCLFMPQNRPMPAKCGITVYSISHSHFIFAHIQVGGQGWSRGWGQSHFIYKTGQKSVHRKKHGCLFADCRPYRPLSTFYG